MNIFYSLTVGVLVFVGAIVALSVFKTPLGFRIYTVQTGSMRPSISAGSVAVVKPFSEYKVGDIVTFKSEGLRKIENPGRTTTHRIVEVFETEEGIRYETKGDANDGPDWNRLDSGLILGKVLFDFPVIGYLVNFAKTQTGFIVLIVVPATLIIYSELNNIRSEVKKMVNERKKRKALKDEGTKEEII